MILNALTAGAGPPAAGPPILLLHGLFGTAKNLGQIARALALRARVISLDLRNHGDSPHAAAMDYGAMAEDVAETMAAAGLSQAAIIGHSMGGKVAMALALTQPALVARLVVMDIAPVSYHHGFDAYIRAMQEIPLSPRLTRHQAEAALTEAVPEPPLRQFLLNNLILGASPRWRMGLTEIAAASDGLMAWNDPPGAAPFTGPTLFLRGGNSDYVGPAADAPIARLFPNAIRQTIDNAGHWLHAEQPRAVIAALEEFLP